MNTSAFSGHTLRSLPSTGVTRLPRYYEPLRHPTRPGLSLASCQLIATAITAGASRVASGLLLRTCHRHYPGRSDGVCSLVSLHRQRPSLCNSQVGSCNYFFGACSAFTHVMACTLAESPSDPFHRKLRQLRCLRCRFDCYRVERTSSRAGVSPAEVQRLFTAHYYVSRSSGTRFLGRKNAIALRFPYVFGVQVDGVTMVLLISDKERVASRL